MELLGSFKKTDVTKKEVFFHSKSVFLRVSTRNQIRKYLFMPIFLAAADRN